MMGMMAMVIIRVACNWPPAGSHAGSIAMRLGRTAHPLTPHAARACAQASEVSAGAVQLPVDSAHCRGGCGVLLALSVPRAPGASCDKLQVVPASKLFDPCAPHTHTLSVQLDVLDASLAVSVSLSGAAAGAAALPTLPAADGARLPYVAPGTSAAVSVVVSDAGGGGAVGGAEVTLYAVDKALLDVLPYPLPRLEAALRLALAASFGPAGVDTQRLPPGAVEAVFESLMTRCASSPRRPVAQAHRRVACACLIYMC